MGRDFTDAGFWAICHAGAACKKTSEALHYDTYEMTRHYKKYHPAERPKYREYYTIVDSKTARRRLGDAIVDEWVRKRTKCKRAGVGGRGAVARELWPAAGGRGNGQSRRKSKRAKTTHNYAIPDPGNGPLSDLDELNLSGANMESESTSNRRSESPSPSELGICYQCYVCNTTTLATLSGIKEHFFQVHGSLDQPFLPLRVRKIEVDDSEDETSGGSLMEIAYDEDDEFQGYERESDEGDELSTEDSGTELSSTEDSEGENDDR